MIGDVRRVITADGSVSAKDRLWPQAGPGSGPRGDGLPHCGPMMLVVAPQAEQPTAYDKQAANQLWHRAGGARQQLRAHGRAA